MRTKEWGHRVWLISVKSVQRATVNFVNSLFLALTSNAHGCNNSNKSVGGSVSEHTCCLCCLAALNNKHNYSAGNSEVIRECQAFLSEYLK